MKKIEVGCAIIFKKDKLLIAQRREGDHLGGYWEFPGGKQRKDETIDACLIREVQEELGVQIKPFEYLREETHDYENRSIRLHFVLCRWVSGEPERIECQDFKWIDLKDIRQYPFPPADTEILNILINRF